VNKKDMREYRIYDGTYMGTDGVKGRIQSTYYKDWYNFKNYSLSLVAKQVKPHEATPYIHTKDFANEDNYTELFSPGEA